MFNAEKLLGTVLSEVIGGGHSKKKRKKRSALSGLATGASVMTIIGLGVGAYEIFKDKQQTATGKPQQPGWNPQPPPLPAQQAIASPPPPPAVPPETTPPVTVPRANTQDTQVNALAIRMIRVMVAAAHADGTLDSSEEETILQRIGNTALSQEEKLFFLDELHNPKSIRELTEGVTDAATARALYHVAISAIDIDTENERKWLDELASQLGISSAVQRFIEEQG